LELSFVVVYFVLVCESSSASAAFCIRLTVSLMPFKRLSL
jgi:hypothetical protein